MSWGIQTARLCFCSGVSDCSGATSAQNSDYCYTDEGCITKPGFAKPKASGIGAICMSGLGQLRAWLLNKQRDRADMYNLEILERVGQIDSVDDLEQLQAV